MHGTSHTGVEGMDRAEDFQGLVDPRELGPHKGFFIRSSLVILVTGGAIPGGGDDGLIIGDLVVFNLDPMAQSAARRFRHVRVLRASLGTSQGVQVRVSPF